MSEQKPYQEGDYFAVPLRNGAFARGRVARVGRSGVLLGYFFGPPLNALPSEEDHTQLLPADAVLIGPFGDLGLTKGRWPILRTGDSWVREQWQCSHFLRYEELTGRNFLVEYFDDDPSKMMSEQEVSREAVGTFPKDGMMGAGFVEAKLTLVLGGGQSRAREKFC